MVKPESDEIARLQALRAILGQLQRHPLVSVGVAESDDAALLQITESHSLVIGSDFVRGSGFDLFRLGLMSYRDVGYYLVIANLSDIAAMGAKPLCLTTIVRYRSSMSDQEFAEVFDGIRAAAEAYGVDVIGGDIGTYECDVFAATAVGTVETQKALLRRNVHAHDLLCVTGSIGLPIAALVYFKLLRPAGLSLEQDAEQRLLNAWRRPIARVKEGLLLGESRLAHACQDVSDGLRATVEQLSDCSGQTFTLLAEHLPIDGLTREVARMAGIEPIHLAMSASVDFELAFTVARDMEAPCRAALATIGTPLSVIGEVNESGRNEVLMPGGERRPLPGVAWRHQTDDVLQVLKADRDAE